MFSKRNQGIKALFFTALYMLSNTYLFAQVSVKNIQSILEKNNLISDTQSCSVPFTMQKNEIATIPVYSENDFKKVEPSKTTLFDIRCDIKLSQTVNFHSDKGIIIKGNGHKIYQTSKSTKKYIKKRLNYISEYKEKINGTEVFTNSKGKLLRLSKTPIYKALSWNFDEKSNTVRIQLPKECKSWNINETDQVYINYEIWFTRQKDKVISAKDGILIFKVENKYKPEGTFISYTPAPCFYLENMKQTRDGVLIKNNKIQYAAKYGSISLCKLQSLFIIDKQTLLDCYDLKFGAGLECMVKNFGTARFQNCSFENAEASGIKSYNNLIVKNCHFQYITQNAIITTPKSNSSITYSTFKNIGKYGLNTACIQTLGNVYAAHNEFKDFNYSAFILGNISTHHEEELPISLIEYNKLSWSKRWQKQMQMLGLSDSGAIYVGTNNQHCTIRFNTINNFGGHGSNRGIFCDDGAYNLSIYGNIVNKTANSYDIDSRNCATITYRQTPKGYKFNTNNFISYNICEKSIRVEGNSLEKENKCYFIHNIIIGNNTKEPQIRSKNNMTSKKSFLIDPYGKINIKGKYHPSINFLKIWNSLY